MSEFLLYKGAFLTMDMFLIVDAILIDKSFGYAEENWYSHLQINVT